MDSPLAERIADLFDAVSRASARLKSTGSNQDAAIAQTLDDKVAALRKLL